VKDWSSTLSDDVSSKGKSQRALECGSGGSTLFAAEPHGCSIMTCESDAAWLSGVLNATKDLSGTVVPIHCDIGPTGGRGSPYGRQHIDLVTGHSVKPCKKAQQNECCPDLVLIDGRFHSTYFIPTPGCPTRDLAMLFDYRDRLHCHAVDVFAKPIELIGHLARFGITPKLMSAGDFIEHISYFLESQ